MINKTYNDLVYNIRQDLKEEILDYIEQRTYQMEKILENGVMTWANAKGESFDRISCARQKVYAKIIILRNLCSSIYERY